MANLDRTVLFSGAPGRRPHNPGRPSPPGSRLRAEPALRTFCLLLAALFLAGCSVTVGPMGPSSHSGKRGTQRPYTINGKTYYPLDSADGFVEEGVASWYGPNFHGKSTSCGETYDMYAMTAAHKILPMQTMVRVTNLENGRSVVARINDRGPFVAGRVLDLSKAGAEALGMRDKGTARVRLQTVGGIPGAASVQDMPGPFYVQVGAFVNRTNAERLKARMEAAGYAGTRLHYREIDGEAYWRVHAGTFPSLAEAEQARARLVGAFPGAFLVGR